MRRTPRWSAAIFGASLASLIALAAGVRAQPTSLIADRELVQVSDMYFRSKGKHYFEVSYDVGAIARAMTVPEAIVQIGCVSGRTPFGYLGRIIASEHKQRPVRHIGIAVDFESRRLAMRNNGEWMDPGPIETAGLAFPTPEATVCGVMANEPIAELVGRPPALRLNWGQEPFRYAPPPGFGPYGKGVAY